MLSDSQQQNNSRIMADKFFLTLPTLICKSVPHSFSTSQDVWVFTSVSYYSQTKLRRICILVHKSWIRNY
ncbi:hypothetical protein Y032_0371g140 [Ancylostoma ceylanicum]|uniref:Uncharacterized protein n=1 Tax=Ancylostoma ceylanicum TaxID=53326 RepID=A0A016RUF5_9BILA|nr:hypothetical protein Y032_0371g140 [Ancylostoma ceylanicum]